MQIAIDTADLLAASAAAQSKRDEAAEARRLEREAKEAREAELRSALGAVLDAVGPFAPVGRRPSYHPAYSTWQDSYVQFGGGSNGTTFGVQVHVETAPKGTDLRDLEPKGLVRVYFYGDAEKDRILRLPDDAGEVAGLAVRAMAETVSPDQLQEVLTAFNGLVARGTPADRGPAPSVGGPV